jgi:hypothetical protein
MSLSLGWGVEQSIEDRSGSLTKFFQRLDEGIKQFFPTESGERLSSESCVLQRVKLIWRRE